MFYYMGTYIIRFEEPTITAPPRNVYYIMSDEKINYKLTFGKEGQVRHPPAPSRAHKINVLQSV